VYSCRKLSSGVDPYGSITGSAAASHISYSSPSPPDHHHLAHLRKAVSYLGHGRREFRPHDDDPRGRVGQHMG